MARTKKPTPKSRIVLKEPIKPKKPSSTKEMKRSVDAYCGSLYADQAEYSDIEKLLYTEAKKIITEELEAAGAKYTTDSNEAYGICMQYIPTNNLPKYLVKVADRLREELPWSNKNEVLVDFSDYSFEKDGVFMSRGYDIFIVPLTVSGPTLKSLEEVAKDTEKYEKALAKYEADLKAYNSEASKKAREAIVAKQEATLLKKKAAMEKKAKELEAKAKALRKRAA